jgi:hypothetical protein
MRWAFLLTLGCHSGPSPILVPESGVVIVATASDDFETGALSAVSLQTREVFGPITAVSGDPVVQVIDGQVVQINRLGVDTVRLYDPTTWGAPLSEFSVGQGANPHAAARCLDEWWVSLYEKPYLGRFQEGQQIGTLDLSEWADSDGLPEASDLVLIGTRVYVGLQRLDRNNSWIPTSHGTVVWIDCDTGEVDGSVEVGPNPALAAGPNQTLWVASPTVGLQVVDDGALTTPSFDFGDYRPEKLALNDQGLGMVIAHAQDRTGYALFCLDTHSHIATLALETERYLTDVAVVNNEAWVSARRGWLDETAVGGLMIWTLDNCAETTAEGLITTGLDPVSLAVLP